MPVRIDCTARTSAVEFFVDVRLFSFLLSDCGQAAGGREMHAIINHAAQNAIHQAASANHAVVCGQTAVSIITAAKRPLGRKRLSILAKYLPERSSSGTMRMPGCSSVRRTVTSGRRPVERTFTGGGDRKSVV